jgi:hypothetical protein
MVLFQSMTELKMKMLTEREAAILEAYNDKNNWRPPSARTLMKIVGAPGVSSLHKSVKKIRQKGYFIDLVA